MASKVGLVPVKKSWEKPVVYYTAPPKDMFPEGFITLSGRAYVIPENHSSPLVTNGNIVATSRVVKYEEDTGCFETLNTRYVPSSMRGQQHH